MSIDPEKTLGVSAQTRHHIHLAKPHRRMAIEGFLKNKVPVHQVHVFKF